LEYAHQFWWTSISRQFSIKDNTLSNNQQEISPSKNTPEVILDQKGIIKLTGRLITENAEEFFKPIEEWINEYFKNPAEITSIEICIEYINSSGTKYLLYIIREITHIHLQKNTNKFKIDWYYRDEDEDMLEKGRFFASELDVPFNFIRII
jgi:hypothetical protein